MIRIQEMTPEEIAARRAEEARLALGGAPVTAPAKQPQPYEEQADAKADAKSSDAKSSDAKKRGRPKKGA